MTVSELIEKLLEIEAKGKGEYEVIATQDGVVVTTME